MWHDRLVFVLTLDQRHSRTGPDRVPELLAALSGVPTVAAFERTAGDEVQALLDEPAAVRQALLAALRLDGWHCGLGVGGVEEGSWAEGTRSGRGPAYLAAREAVEASAADGTPVAVRVPDGSEKDAARWASDTEAVWTLVAELVTTRTDAQWRVVDAVDAADTQAAAAETLDVRPTSVAGALRRARVREERAAHPVLDRLLAGTAEALDAGAGVRGTR